jgi:hypothetical protein
VKTGTCRYGDQCKFAHESSPHGGGRGRSGSAAALRPNHGAPPVKGGGGGGGGGSGSWPHEILYTFGPTGESNSIERAGRQPQPTRGAVQLDPEIERFWNRLPNRKPAFNMQDQSDVQLWIRTWSAMASVASRHTPRLELLPQTLLQLPNVKEVIPALGAAIDVLHALVGVVLNRQQKPSDAAKCIETLEMIADVVSSQIPV